jgi:uncharacterized protein
MVTQDQIAQLVKEIAEGYKPEKIYLFGSYAHGVPDNDSDIDLFIVKETDERWIDRRIAAKKSIKNYIAPMDIIVYTPREVDAAINLVVNIGKIAINTGKLVYERI